MADILFTSYQKKKLEALKRHHIIEEPLPEFEPVQVNDQTFYKWPQEQESTTKRLKRLYEQLALFDEPNQRQKLSTKQIVAIEKAKLAISRSAFSRMRQAHAKLAQILKDTQKPPRYLGLFGFFAVVGTMSAIAGGIDDGLSVLTYIPHLSGYPLLGTSLIFSLGQTFFYYCFDLRYIGKQVGVSILGASKLMQIYAEQCAAFTLYIYLLELGILQNMELELDDLKEFKDLLNVISLDMTKKQGLLAEVAKKSNLRKGIEWLVTGAGSSLWATTGYFVGKSAAAGVLIKIFHLALFASHPLGIGVIALIGFLCALGWVIGYMAQERKGAMRMLSGDKGKANILSQKIAEDLKTYDLNKNNVDILEKQKSDHVELETRRTQDSENQTEIERLQAENARLQRELTEAQAAITQKNTQIETLNQESTRVNQELSRTNQELTRANQELSRTNQELSRTNQELTRANQVKNQNQTLLKANTTMMDKIVLLKEEKKNSSKQEIQETSKASPSLKIKELTPAKARKNFEFEDCLEHTFFFKKTHKPLLVENENNDRQYSHTT